LTVTYNYLVGTFEDPAESMRKFFHDVWNLGDTNGVKPKMYSPLGFDDNESSTDTKDEHRSADWDKPRTGDYIRYHTINTVRVAPDSQVNDIVRMSHVISIDVFSVNSFRMALFMEELSNIIFANQPTQIKRIPKTDGEDSAIADFDKMSFDFTTIGLFTDKGIIRGKNTTLGCVVEKFIT